MIGGRRGDKGKGGGIGYGGGSGGGDDDLRQRRKQEKKEHRLAEAQKSPCSGESTKS